MARKWTTNAEGFIKFRNAQFAAFKNTEEYCKALAETAKEGSMAPQENEELLREYYSGRYMSMIFEDQPQSNKTACHLGRRWSKNW